MARPSKHDIESLLDAAAHAYLERGHAVTIADVSRTAGAPTGSIYHRFGSREELLVTLWLRSIRRFHVGFGKACALSDPREAVVAAARHIPVYCRENPVDAYAMTLFRQPHVVAEGPPALREQAATINDEIDAITEELGRRRYGEFTDRRRDLLRTATRLSPYGLVRPYVGGEIPTWLEEATAASTEAIAALGD